jgi:regulatory protein
MDFPVDEKRIGEAFQAAVKYIAASPRSEKEVKEKLYAKGFHKNEVEAALEKAKGYRYVDDESYVRAFLDFYKDKYGRKKLQYKLTSEKGVSKELVDGIFDELVSDGAEIEKALTHARKYMKSKRMESLNSESASKLGAHLYQKGFEWSIISKAVAALGADEYERE